jgi:hypothetical protein
MNLSVWLTPDKDAIKVSRKMVSATGSDLNGTSVEKTLFSIGNVMVVTVYICITSIKK